MNARALLCCLALAACKKPAPARELELRRVAPAVGQRVVIDDHLASRMDVTPAPGETSVLVTTRVRTSRQEVLAVSPDGIVTGVAVRYDAHHDRFERDGKTESKVSPVEGHAYRVTADAQAAGAPLAVVRDDGVAVSPAEQAAIDADLGRSVGKRPAISALLLSRRWRTGEPETLTADELRGAFGQNPAMQPSAGTALLVGIARGVATFEFDLTLVRDEAESPVRMTMLVDVARSRPIEMTIIGSLHGRVAGLDANGTLEGRVTYKYE